MTDTGIFSVFLLVELIIVCVAVFFSISLFKALRRIPEDKLLFPAWFVWLLFIPVAGFVFFWIMLPFGIPTSFRQALPNNSEAQNRAGTLFGLGLTFCILLVLSLVPVLAFIFFIPMFVIWIIYWVKVVTFRRLYLDVQ